MKQYVLQSLGISVPQIALGTVELGLPYGFGLDGETSQPTFEQAERLVHAALDTGIRFIDTARAYGNSEEILGRCLGGRRAGLVLATKVGPLNLEDNSDAQLEKAIHESVDQSLCALRTDYVDWLMIHSATVAHLQQLARILGPLESLRRQGKARAIGASIYNDALSISLDEPRLACLQVAGSAIDRRVETALAQRPACGKDFVMRSVLLRGALTGKYRALPASMQQLHDAISQLDRIAAEAGISLTELAYRYAAKFNGVMLVGTASISELEEAIRFVERGQLSDDILAAIRSTASLDDHLLNPAKWPSFEAHTPETTAR